VEIATTEGRLVRIQVGLDGGGFVGLRGNTVDRSAWPRTWTIRDVDLQAIRDAGPWIDLPTAAAVRLEREAIRERIRRWLGDDRALPGLLFSVDGAEPASDAAIENLGRRVGFPLPAAYVHLLRGSNGIAVFGVAILGTLDAYPFDGPGPARLVISPPDENGAFVLDATGAVEWIPVERPSSPGIRVAADLRLWFATRLGERGTETSTPAGGSAARP
jgi:hypothetical protein